MFKFIISILSLVSLQVIASSKVSQTLTEQIAIRKTNSSKKMSLSVKREFQRAIKELKARGIEKNSIQKGVHVPSFNLENRRFKSFYKKYPIVLKFYRGSWCPYCQLEMKDYEKYKSKIESKGYKLIVLTPDTKLEIRKFRKRQEISFPIFQDKDNHIAKKFGIAFKLDKKVTEIYKGFGIDLAKNQNNLLNEIPMPGTYVINKKGIITFTFVDADYTKRLDPLDLLKVLK